MSRSIPTLTIPPGHPRAFAQRIFPAPGHLTANFFPAPGHLTTPGSFRILEITAVWVSNFRHRNMVSESWMIYQNSVWVWAKGVSLNAKHSYDDFEEEPCNRQNNPLAHLLLNKKFSFVLLEISFFITVLFQYIPCEFLWNIYMEIVISLHYLFLSMNLLLRLLNQQNSMSSMKSLN